MKVLAIFIVVACAYCVYGEKCSTVSDCTATSCSATADHVHVQCVANHCTCSADKLPCLTVSDCQKGKCFDRDGRNTDWHCLDGSCTCLRV